MSVQISSKDTIIEWFEQNKEKYAQMARDIWEHPQTAYEETYASELQQTELQSQGFTIKNDIGGLDTAFIAEYGQGKPVIGILGEFDALPGLSQTATPDRKSTRLNSSHVSISYAVFCLQKK